MHKQLTEDLLEELALYRRDLEERRDQAQRALREQARQGSLEAVRAAEAKLSTIERVIEDFTPSKDEQ